MGIGNLIIHIQKFLRGKCTTCEIVLCYSITGGIQHYLLMSITKTINSSIITEKNSLVIGILGEYLRLI